MGNFCENMVFPKNLNLNIFIIFVFENLHESSSCSCSCPPKANVRSFEDFSKLVIINKQWWPILGNTINKFLRNSRIRTNERFFSVADRNQNFEPKINKLLRTSYWEIQRNIFETNRFHFEEIQNIHCIFYFTANLKWDHRRSILAGYQNFGMSKLFSQFGIE